MARKKNTNSKPKANKTKDQLAKELQAGLLKTSPAENLERNVEFAGQMSTSIGSIIENLSVENDVDFSEEQKKIFADMLETLKKIATSQGDTGKDREELRTMFAKMVVQTEKQTEKIEKDIVEKDKQVESKEEEIRYLEHWQEKAEEDTTLSEKEKEKVTKDLEARVEELKVLRSEKEKLNKSLEAQKKLGEEVKDKMQEPEQKRLTLMDAIKGDTSSALKKFAPGLNWNPEEGQGYGDMLKSNMKKMTTGKGFMEAFGSVLLEPDKKLPSNEKLIEAERQAARQQEEMEGLMGKMSGDGENAAVADTADAIEKATSHAETTDILPTLQSLLQEVTIIRGVVEGSLSRDKGGKYRDSDTGKYIGKAEARTAGRGLHTKEELNEQLGLSSSELKDTDIKDLEKMAAEEGRISPLERAVSAEEEQEEVRADIVPPAQELNKLEEQGKIQLEILSALKNIEEDANTSAEIDEERDREEDADQTTLDASEVRGEVEPIAQKAGVALANQSPDEESGGGQGGIGQAIMDKYGSRVMKNIGGRLGNLATKTGGMKGQLIRGGSRMLLGSMGTAVGGGAAAAGTAAAGGLAAGAGTAAAGTLAAGAGTAVAGGGMLAAAGGLAAAAAPWLAGAAAIGAIGYGAYKLFQWRKKKREEKQQAEEAQKAELQNKQAQISTEAASKTSDMVTEATENAATDNMGGISESNVVNNVSSSSGGETPALGPTEVRIQDNSFIRFQDKRVARV
jgi:hypothetical protein